MKKKAKVSSRRRLLVTHTKGWVKYRLDPYTKDTSKLVEQAKLKAGKVVKDTASRGFKEALKTGTRRMVRGTGQKVVVHGTRVLGQKSPGDRVHEGIDALERGGNLYFKKVGKSTQKYVYKKLEKPKRAIRRKSERATFGMANVTSRYATEKLAHKQKGYEYL